MFDINFVDLYLFVWKLHHSHHYHHHVQSFIYLILLIFTDSRCVRVWFVHVADRVVLLAERHSRHATSHQHMGQGQTGSLRTSLLLMVSLPGGNSKAQT